MKSRSGIASNIAWVGIGNGIALVVGFISSILLARWLGPEARGIYALMVTTSTMAAAILGNNAWIQTFGFLTGKKRYPPQQIAGHGLIISLVCTLLVAIPLIILPGPVLESLLPKLRQVHLWIIVLLVASTMTFSALTGLLLGLDQIPLLTTLATAKSVVALSLHVLLLGFLSLGLQGALWELVLSSVLGLGMALVIFTWKVGIDPRLESNFIKDATTYGGKVYPSHLGLILFSRADLYFVTLFGGFEAAGLYAVAKGLTEITSILEQSISQGVLPDVINGDFTTAGSLVARAFRVTFWLSALILLAGALLAGRLIPLIYGPEFIGVVPAFLWLLPGTLFLTTRILGTFFSLQIGRPEIPTYYVLATGLISLPVSYFLTRQYGYLGAAAAFSIVAILRGLIAMGLFVVFSRLRVRDVLLINRADLLLLSRTVRPWLRGRTPREQQT